MFAFRCNRIAPADVFSNTQHVCSSDMSTDLLPVQGATIKEEKQMAMRLWRTEEVGLFDINFDTGERYWSYELRHILGIPRDTPADFHLLLQCVHPEDRRAFYEMAMQAFEARLSAWLVWLGLVRLGYAEQAQRLVDALAAAVAREGLREYYHPFTGRGMGAAEFGWSALMMEMVEPDPRAAYSYLA